MYVDNYPFSFLKLPFFCKAMITFKIVRLVVKIHHCWRRRLKLLHFLIKFIHLQISQDDLSMYVENNDLPSYLRKMSREGTWGDHLTIMALARVLQRNIWIVSSSRDHGDHIVIETGNANADPLLIGYVCNNHYVSLEPSRELTAIEGKNSFILFKE